MRLKEKAAYYYLEEMKGCGVALLLAARDVYGIELTDSEIAMMGAFSTGMGCQMTCGALTGAIAVLGKLYAKMEDVRPVSAGYVEAFQKALKIKSLNCSEIRDSFFNDERRCVNAVEIAAETLEAYIDKLEGRDRTRETDPTGCTISPDDIKRVKGQGFLNHKGTNKFNGRVITRNGKITAEEARKMAEASEKYGDGSMMLTTRLTMEISGIEYDNIEAFQACIAEAGLYTGGTGSKVRPVVSCKSTTCQYGLYDAYALSDKIHDKFYLGYHDVNLPHKFKIALGGCPNNCVKPNLNDLGVIGAKVPLYDKDKCRGCKKCQIEASCPIKAAGMQDGKLVIDETVCNQCGRCVGKCPFHCADEGTYGWKIYVGGRWGKKVAHGKMLNKLFTTEQEVMDTIEKAILLFRSEGISGERFADTIDRIGFEKAEELLLGNELLEKKAEILGLNVVGGATC